MKQLFAPFFLSFLIISVLSLPAFAQQNQDEEGNLLPDIESQNIEIRGEFTAQFPGLERQPILGFNPTLRVYQFPADRIPFMEPGSDAVAKLALSEFAVPEGPAYTPLQYTNVNYLFARLGFGSYESPAVQLWGALPVSDDSYIGIDVDYTASNEGHLADRPTSYRYLTGNVEYGVRLNEDMDLYVYAGLQNDFNYAARFGVDNTGEIARIEFEGIHAGATLSNFRNEITGWKLKGGLRSFNTEYKTEFMPGKIDEMVYSGSFSYRWALGNPGETITAVASARGGMYEPENTAEEQWGTYYAGLAYERLFNYTTRLYAEGDLYYISNFAESGIYPGANVSLIHWFGSRLKITGRVEAKPILRTVEQFHERNRFLGYNYQLRHTYSIRVNGEAALKWYRGSRLYGGVTYLNAVNYSYFAPETSSPPTIGIGPVPSRDYYTVNYADATNMKIYAGISHQLAPETFWLNVQIYLQNPMLNSDEPIPYSENLGLNASITYRPVERITVKGWVNYLGDREPGLEGTELDDIFLVGGQLDVRIIDGIGAYIKVINLLDQEYQYWQGYIERPLQLYGGITITL